MVIHLDVNQTSVPREFRETVGHFAECVLGRFGTRVARVEVMPHSDAGGKQRAWHCHLRLRLRPSGEIVIKDADRELDVALVRAFGRARRMVARFVGYRSVSELPRSARPSERRLRLSLPGTHRTPLVAQTA